MKATLQTIVFFVLAFCTFISSAQSLSWVDHITVSNPSLTGNFSNIASSAVDASGNVYVVGTFSGTLNFDATHSAGPSVENDIWFGKYDPNGNLLWAQALIGGGEDSGADITLDNTGGNLYIVGTFENDVSNINFNPGGRSPFNLSPGLFCAKYTCSTGAFVNAISIGNGNVDGTAVGFSGNGNPCSGCAAGLVWVAGTISQYSATTLVQTTPWGASITLSGANGTIFLATYTTDLTKVVGVTSLTNTAAGQVNKMVCSNNTAYATGTFLGGGLGNGNNGSLSPANGSAFVATCNYSVATGTTGYSAFQILGILGDSGNGITLDNSGQLYVTGKVSNSFYLAKYIGNASSPSWLSSTANAVGSSVTIFGNYVYVTGSLSGLATIGGTTLTASGDFFIGTYGLSGSQVTGIKLGLNALSFAPTTPSIIYNSTGGVFLTGGFTGTGGTFSPTACPVKPVISSTLSASGFIANYVGAPYFYFSGPFNLNQYSSGTYTASPGYSNYTWSATNFDLRINSQTANTVVMFAYSVTGGSTETETLNATATDVCGVSHRFSQIVTLLKIGGFAAFPNPSSQTLTVAAVKPTDQTAEAAQTLSSMASTTETASSVGTAAVEIDTDVQGVAVNLLNKLSQVVAVGTMVNGSVILKTDALPNDIYYLHIGQGKNMIAEQIIVQH